MTLVSNSLRIGAEGLFLYPSYIIMLSTQSGVSLDRVPPPEWDYVNRRSSWLCDGGMAVRLLVGTNGRRTAEFNSVSLMSKSTEFELWDVGTGNMHWHRVCALNNNKSIHAVDLNTK